MSTKGLLRKPGEKRQTSWPVELFLGRQLLLVVAPSADLQPATDPAKLLRLLGRGIGATDCTLQGLLHNVVGQRPLGRFQNFRWNHGFGFRLRFSSHTHSEYPRN